jgi:hypothetical protein
MSSMLSAIKPLACEIQRVGMFGVGGQFNVSGKIVWHRHHHNEWIVAMLN